MSGNFLRTYEAELQDRVPEIRRKIGFQALLNAMRSRTLQRNYALRALQVPVVDLDGDLYPQPVAGFPPAWYIAMHRLFRPGMSRFMHYTEHEEWPTGPYPIRFPPGQAWIDPRGYAGIKFGNPTNYWIQMMTKRLAMQFKMAIRRARKRLQNRHLENYSSGNPLVDLF